MFRAFLFVLASAALFLWHKTRLPDVEPLRDEQLAEVSSPSRSDLKAALARDFERAVDPQLPKARAPASVAPVVVGEAPPPRRAMPAGLPDGMEEIEKHLREDLKGSVGQLTVIFDRLGPAQHEERAYVLNLALGLGHDVAPELVQLGARELQTQISLGESEDPSPARLESLQLGIRLVVYNSTDPGELGQHYLDLRQGLPSDRTKDELARVFPTAVVEEFEKQLP